MVQSSISRIPMQSTADLHLGHAQTTRIQLDMHEINGNSVITEIRLTVKYQEVKL